MNGRSASTPMRASGSSRRQRVHKVDTRWDKLEYASLLAAAESTGLTRGGFIRALVLGQPGPRTQRAPSLDVVALAKAVAALNKAGSVANQLARVLNSGGTTVTSQECFAALKDLRSAVTHILEIASSRRML